MFVNCQVTILLLCHFTPQSNSKICLVYKINMKILHSSVAVLFVENKGDFSSLMAEIGTEHYSEEPSKLSGHSMLSLP